MNKLGGGSGVSIYEDGTRLLVVNSGAGELGLLIFLSGLLTFIAGVLGVMFLFSGNTLGGPFLAAAGVTGALLGLAIWGFVRRRRRPPEQQHRVAVIDLEARTLCDGQGRVLAPLNRVQLEKRFQLGSSSPALVAVYPEGKLELASGNPFAGGLGTLVRALRSKGLVG